LQGDAGNIYNEGDKLNDFGDIFIFAIPSAVLRERNYATEHFLAS
jgi:hypothetical protein